MAFKQSGTNVINDDKSFAVVADTTATRNASPVVGMIRYNTTLSQYEFYNGTVWGPVSVVGAPSDAYAWGANGSGQLGDSTTTSGSSPVSVVGGVTDWIQISAGDAHTAAIRANGTAWCWGNNGAGRLGINSAALSALSPVSVVRGFTDWVQISAGFQHTAAVRANGTAWAWGANGSGRLGDGTSTSRFSPVAVVGGFTDWVQISTGRYHTAAIRANGTAWAWGFGSTGRLGDGTAIGKTSPVSVVGGFTDWVQISAGYSHTAAIRSNGTAWAWGWNRKGEVGDGTAVSKNSPVSVLGGFTDWVQISTGNSFTAAIRANGTAWAWGASYGRLGDGVNVSRSSPVSIVGGFTDWVQISTGDNHTTAIRANGTAWAWGAGAYGQRGDGLTGEQSSPVSVIGGFTDWVQISAGKALTAAIRR